MEVNFKILIVEDDMANQYLMREYINSLNISGEIVCNAEQAIDELKTEKYAMCFMDLRMDGITGVEATKIIRREIGDQLPIIALTASAMAGDREKCIEAGMNDFLTKPVSINDFEAMIEKYKKF